jgi:Ca2+-binding EF-hand superfamily protein
MATTAKAPAVGKTTGKTKQPPAPAKSAPAPAKPAIKPAEKKPEVKLDVEAAFNALDKEGVGFLVLEKLRPSLRRKGYTARFVEHLFCHLGPDLRGRVTRAHFLDALKCLPKGIFALNEAMSDDELLEVYEEADKEKTESLTVEQLTKFYSARGVSAKFLMDYLFLIDILGDGVVTLANYKRTLGIPGATEDDINTKVARQLERLKDLFDECDLDESGELCLEEIRIVLKQKGYSDHFVERFYCHLDINKDGAVTREEFYEALKIIPKEIFLYVTNTETILDI